MKNKPKIGDLRHLVDIQNATDTTDDAGGFTQVYDTVTSVFASIKPKKGTEVYGEGSQGMQLENAITHEIFIRWRDDKIPEECVYEQIPREIRAGRTDEN